MNDRTFIEMNCNRCVNKTNENDLCNIVEKINGTYGCPNEDCININDYIRNEDGDIGIVKKYYYQMRKWNQHILFVILQWPVHI